MPKADARIPGWKNLIWVGGGFPTIDPATIDGNDALEAPPPPPPPPPPF